jgi:soluble lytic murein transglycosylase
LYQLGRTLESPAEIGLIAEYARIIDKRQASIRLSKIAFNRGLALGEYAFPTDVIPPYRRLNDGVEEGLIYALTRQESEFNVKAKSRAGARGLMQLMPRTARSIARSYKIRYRKAKLTKDGSYNVMLGSAHLRDLVDDFGGSYIMAIASYNAGNPRDPETDPLDWIERIPFTETRRYVRKVLFGMQVYRARLEGSENALQILQDLSRGKRRHVLTSVAEDISSRGASPCHIIAPDRSTQLICF